MVVRNGSMAAIAADTGISMGGVVIPGSRLIGPRKLVRSSGSVIGFVGDVANLTAVEARLRRRALGRFKDRAGLHDAWCRLHSDLKENHFLRPESSDDEDGFESTHVTALVASPCGIFAVYPLREVLEFVRFWAAGSGAEIALGVLDQCFTGNPRMLPRLAARRAVEAASRLDPATRTPVSVEEVSLRGAALA